MGLPCQGGDFRDFPSIARYERSDDNAVLTTDTMEQAVERSQKGCNNKGYDAALAAVEMAVLFEKLEHE